MQPLEELTHLLRPAGGGLYLVSTGRAEQEALQKRLYGARSEEEVQGKWKEALSQIPSAQAVILGIPSDVGAGFLRGANQGPQALRTALLAEGDFPTQLKRARVVDVGDVFVCPQLLHDSMLSDAQIQASRRALYPAHPEATLPVSPLSIAERALDLIFQLNPSVKVLVLGGDHSCAWPTVSALHRVYKENWGIVQPDAHTDLLEERLGVKYCFATWSFHANDMLGRNGHLVQVGTRASRKDKSHWEATLGVRQFWAQECNGNPQGVEDALVAHLKSKGITHLYFSNDIDGTDESFVDATGTPEPQGLTPVFVISLIRRLGKEFTLIGGDLMEVAPAVARTPDGAARTVSLGARYIRETLSAMLHVDFSVG